MHEIELIHKAQQGDLTAFQELMNRHYRTVEKFSYQCGVHVDDISDVTQEVFIKLFRFLSNFKEAQFTTWLYTITLNTARDYYRKTNREKMKQERWTSYSSKHTEPSAEKEVLLYEEDRELHNAIVQLSEKYRLPLILFYFQDQSYDEIAAILSISSHTVKVRLHRAKAQLKKVLEQDSRKESDDEQS